MLPTGGPTRDSSTSRHPGRSAAPGTRLDGEELDRAVAFYTGQALADSTKKSYRSAKRRYHAFCQLNHIPPLPVCEQHLCRYVASLANDGLAHTSIKAYLSGVRHLQVEEGWGDPKFGGMPKLELVLREVKRTQAMKNKIKPRQPITPDLLLKLRGVWLKGPRGGDGTMLWAAATLCFFGFLRSGEITVPSDSEFDASTHLTFLDVAVDKLQAPSMLKVHIKASKTDPFRVGGREGRGPLCPVSAVLDYLLTRGGGEGPLFHFIDGKPLMRSRLMDCVRQALQEAGIDSKPYSGLSFRIGAATTAAKEGVGDATIKMLGRWRSNAYQLYIKTPREYLAAGSSQLVRGVRCSTVRRSPKIEQRDT